MAPGAYVQFLRLDGRELTDPILDQKRITGRWGEVLRCLDEWLTLNIRSRAARRSRDDRLPDDPRGALRQLARNVVMHRSHEQCHSPVRLHWYKDRMEILSAGGLHGQVTPENFGQRSTDYRKPWVAEIMFHLGYAQRFGMGIPLAKRALEQNASPPPKFRLEPTWVAATLRPAP